MNKKQAVALAKVILNSVDTGWRFHSYYYYHDANYDVGIIVENNRTGDYHTLLSREDWDDLIRP